MHVCTGLYGNESVLVTVDVGGNCDWNIRLWGHMLVDGLCSELDMLVLFCG